MKNLLGSKAQIKWAEEIREKFCSCLDSHIKEEQERINAFLQMDQYHGAAAKAKRKLEKTTRAYEYFLEIEGRSWWWIGIRDDNFVKVCQDHR